MVAFYGAPQAHELGELGIGSPDSAARRLRRQAAPYARKTRPILPAFELIATIANGAPGADGMYRTQQPHGVIRRYLRAARRAKALLVLDIQPGHADFTDEVRRLDRYLREPDVGLALDPEWHTPGAQPGTVIGSVTAGAGQRGRPPRRPDRPGAQSCRRSSSSSTSSPWTWCADKQLVEQPRGLAVTMNVDGFGSRAAKVSKYRLFTSDGKRFNDGFKLFYREDTGLMKPRSVLALQPPPDLRRLRVALSAPSPERMTAIVSPAAIGSPSEMWQLLDRPRLVGGDLVLHLHRLDDADELALLDGLRPARRGPSTCCPAAATRAVAVRRRPPLLRSPRLRARGRRRPARRRWPARRPATAAGR